MSPVTEPPRKIDRPRRVAGSLVPPKQRRSSPTRAVDEPSTEEYRAFGNVEARNRLQALIEVPLLVRTLALPRGGCVLDIGCGRGIALPVLAEQLEPTSLLGLDVDPALVALAGRRVHDSGIEATVLEADVRDIPLASGSVDLVIDFGTCFHVSGGPDGARQALAEVARVLSPGGLFVHETRVAQGLAHPVRSFGRRLPWDAAPSLVRVRWAMLWAACVKVDGGDL